MVTWVPVPIAGATPDLGQEVMDDSVPVVLASNQSAIPVSQPGLSGQPLQAITTVGTSAVPLPAVAATNRAALTVQNVGATTIFLGGATVTAGTTATGGFQLVPMQSKDWDLAAGSVLYAISSAAGGLVCTVEVPLA